MSFSRTSRQPLRPIRAEKSQAVVFGTEISKPKAKLLEFGVIPRFVWKFPMKKLLLALLTIAALSGAILVVSVNPAAALPPGPCHGGGEGE